MHIVFKHSDNDVLFLDICMCFMRTIDASSLYHHQQNKCYPQKCVLAHFEATLDFSRSEFTCP